MNIEIARTRSTFHLCGNYAVFHTNKKMCTFLRAGKKSFYEMILIRGKPPIDPEAYYLAQFHPTCTVN